MLPEELRGRLRQGDTEFLRGLPPAGARLDEALRLGPGASYCLAQQYAALGLTETSDALLAQEARRGRSPWREEAVLALAGRLLAQQRYEEAESLLREARVDESRERGGRGGRLLIEVLYWQERDQEAREALEARRREGAAWDAELDLFEAVVRCRLNDSGWQQHFTRLFLRVRASSLHVRAYGFLEQRGSLADFGPAMAAVFEAKDLLYRGQPAEALERLEPLLAALPAEAFADTLLVEELGAAYFAAPAVGRGARALLDRSASLTGQARLDCREMAGRLLRRQGDPGAVELLEEVRRESALAAQRDRAAWFLLDMARERGAFLDELGRQAPASSWAQPAYFADILEREITRLSARRAWGELLRLHRLLPAGGPTAVRSRLEFILARAASLGLLPGGAVQPESLLEAARARDRGGYYGLLAEACLGPGWSGGGWLSAAAAPETAPAADAASVGPGAQEQAALVEAYLSFGLYDQAVERLLAARGELPPAFVLQAATELRDRGRHRASIRVAAAVGRAEPGRDVLELLYPRAYAEEVEAVAGRENLDPGLFYALVREESLFDPRAVSSSGAVGLTQLMGDAAADAARRLGLQPYDLRDPVHNLRLGGRHLGRLQARLEDVPKSLMAYNAGLSRLRAWESSFAGLPTDLLLEALPFPETQGYVRKILVSAVRYDLLYFGRPAAQTVTGFFPGLSDRKESSP